MTLGWRVSGQKPTHLCTRNVARQTGKVYNGNSRHRHSVGGYLESIDHWRIALLCCTASQPRNFGHRILATQKRSMCMPADWSTGRFCPGESLDTLITTWRNISSMKQCATEKKGPRLRSWESIHRHYLRWSKRCGARIPRRYPTTRHTRTSLEFLSLYANSSTWLFIWLASFHVASCRSTGRIPWVTKMELYMVFIVASYQSLPSRLFQILHIRQGLVPSTHSKPDT